MIEVEGQQHRRFLYLYALAAAGGAVAYVPLLTVLLPARISGISGSGAEIAGLAWITLAGALAASLSNILFGWLSDLTGNRRGWIVAGLASSSLLLVTLPLAQSLPTVIAWVVLWQVGLNMMLAPLTAWAGDCVPDEQKGTLGGLLAFAPALGAASGALVTIPGLASADTRLWLVAGLAAIMVLPVLVAGRPAPTPWLMRDPVDLGPDAPRGHLERRSAVIRMWIARLLVQVAEAALFAYLLFWFVSIDPAMKDSDTARIFALVLGLAVPLAILVGRWSDRTGRPIFPLVACAVGTSFGLVLMALANGLVPAIAGYIVFGLAATVFLSLHTSQTLRVLPKARSRGRDMGVFNLTNTMPSLVMPWLALQLVPTFGFAGLFWLLASLAGLAALLLLTLVRPQAKGWEP